MVRESASIVMRGVWAGIIRTMKKMIAPLIAAATLSLFSVFSIGSQASLDWAQATDSLDWAMTTQSLDWAQATKSLDWAQATDSLDWA